MIDEDEGYDGIGSKYLPAARLAELLAQVPPSARVRCNSVGNLMVESEDGTTMLAYIKFLGEGEVVSLTDNGEH